ncbi:hypothetical protein CHARACLAT_030177 [Characodon lateralis]|uniref:Uncharacterized protein n=1 Tax=Characodon lateralis TaxID=208331 RepID=A0ABU7ENU2_9TELE|nr:hypothetical protein [Characodon lateralis]
MAFNTTFFSFCFSKATLKISFAAPSDDIMAECVETVGIHHQKYRKLVRTTLNPWTVRPTMFCHVVFPILGQLGLPKLFLFAKHQNNEKERFVKSTRKKGHQEERKIEREKETRKAGRKDNF